MKCWSIEKECFVLDDGPEWFLSNAGVAKVYGLPYGDGKMPIELFEEEE